MTIEINNLKYSWGTLSEFKNNSSRLLFEDFNAKTDKAGIYALFGINGSGKSTLLKLISGLLTPDNGSIKVNGFTPRLREPDFLSDIYFLPEEFHLPNLTTERLLKNYGGIYPNFSGELFKEYLEIWKAPNNQSFKEMSLGQKKKAIISFALATRTKYLLMDEPTNGLDIVSRSIFKQIIIRPENKDRTIIISTHQAHDLERLIDYVWFISDGKMILSSDMNHISNKLSTGIVNTANELPSDFIYMENIGEQYQWLAKNISENIENIVPLELLYKAMSLKQAEVVKALE